MGESRRDDKANNCNTRSSRRGFRSDASRRHDRSGEWRQSVSQLQSAAATLADTKRVFQLDGQLISEGRAFLSNVYVLSVQFDIENAAYTCVLKVPLHRNWSARASGTAGAIANEAELLRVAASYHNSECEHYAEFKGLKKINL